MLIGILGICLLFLASESVVWAQSENETVEAEVKEVLKEGKIESYEGGEGWEQWLRMEVIEEGRMGEEIFVKSGVVGLVNQPKYERGDEVVLMKSKVAGEERYMIIDYVRREALYWLFGLFVLVAVVVGRKWGLLSILGMGFSFLVIFKLLIPLIMQGWSPVLVSIMTSALIIPVTFYLSHGLNKKTSVAVVSTLISLVITGVLVLIFTETTKLTGFASEEAGFLQVQMGGEINIKGLLLAGMIIGTLGILDDVTINQAAIVEKLKEANKEMGFGELYKKAMSVGQDHISSMVNTLVLVYTGASLPLLLLFVDSSRSFGEVLNNEIVADEIVRTLVGSVGLMLAVPITTFLAAKWMKRAD